MIRAVDLFCGAGGSSVGARAAGARIVAGFDRWDLAIRTFRDNFPEAAARCCDLRRVSAGQVAREVGAVDLIVGSPECRAHTPARGGWCIPDDSSMTAFEVVRFARVLKPRWVVIENVPQMRRWHLYPRLLESLASIGYRVREQILNARDFGVPQSRRRLFIMCDLERVPPPVIPRCRRFVPALRVVDLDGRYAWTPLFAPGRARATVERAMRAIRTLGPGEPFLVVYYGTDGAGGWQRLDVPLRTVTTRDRFAIVKWESGTPLMRMLQPEELRAAMGLPASFVLRHGTRRQRIHLLGNAVCPPVMEAVVRTLSGPRS
ncbi:MAG: DNA cytosine methyltransferase [Armatimonadota bacterium]|nr:DNA cytosine methyltransferase [Armatimonadota bacterium]